MRWQLIAIGFAVVAVAAWLAFQPRSSAPDPVVARDRLVASDAVVATFSPGGAEGYRFTAVKGEGWVWERTSGSDGSPLPDAIVYNGSRYLMRVSDGCFIQLSNVKSPLVPGLTVSSRLVNQPGLNDERAAVYSYSVDSTAFARSGALPVSMRVTEDLSGLKSGGEMRASTGQPPGAVWPGDYTVVRASDGQRTAAQALIRGASPSDYATLTIRERVVGTTILNNSILGPYRIVIPQACPDHPTLLSGGVEGGQVEGLRSSPSPLRFVSGSPVLIDRAVESRLLFRAPVDAFNEAAAGAVLDTVPVTSTSTIIARITGGGFLAVQIDSCDGRSWFTC
mgnify:CR=1 FL=1